jgi:hypothetical protein
LKLLWVHSNKIGSKLIRWGLDTDCSHFAICFDEGQIDDPLSETEIDKGIAFHSYGSGTQLTWLKSFIRKNYVVHALEPREELTLAQEEAVYKAILESEADRPYDYAALAWFGWRAALYKFLGWEIGGPNRWQHPEARLCTGIAPAVLKAVGIPDAILAGQDIELLPPHRLFTLLQSSGLFTLAKDWAVEARHLYSK